MTGLIAAIVVLAGHLIEYSTAVIALPYVYGTVWAALGRWQAMLTVGTIAVPEAPVGCCCTSAVGA